MKRYKAILRDTCETVRVIGLNKKTGALWCKTSGGLFNRKTRLIQPSNVARVA